MTIPTRLRALGARLNAALDRATAWITPTRRTALYQGTLLVGAILVGVGVVDADTATTIVGHVIAAGTALAGVLAAIKARNGLRKSLYALGVVVLAALKYFGVVTDGEASHYLDLGGQVLGLLPLLLALAKTDPRTATGEPLAEYRARHAGLAARRFDRGQL